MIHRRLNAKEDVMGKDTIGTQLPWGTEITKNEDGEKTGWIDDKGDVHKPGDTGGPTGDPETIGHKNNDGSVTWKKD